MKLPLTREIKLIQTIQCYNGPNIGFAFGNSTELTSLNKFTVFQLIILIILIISELGFLQLSNWFSPDSWIAKKNWNEIQQLIIQSKMDHHTIKNGLWLCEKL